METTRAGVESGEALRRLKAATGGRTFSPGEAGYEAGRQGFNLSSRQEPSVVVFAESTEDVVAAVRYAAAQRLGVGVLATGHGVGRSCDGGVLINTSRMRAVRIDPEGRTATVEAGALWRDVVPAAQEHGLMGLTGSTTGVGVVGYTLGGGFGWLGRKHGYAANQLVEAEVVSASGERLRVSARENPELFWGLKGSAGNFGVVTSLKFGLFPLRQVYGGTVFFPVSRAEELLGLYARWTREMPDELASGIAFLNLPPLPFVPEPLRGGSFISLRACYCGEDPAEGERLLAPWREVGEPVMSTLGPMPCAAMDAISMDPTDPIGVYGHMELLDDLTSEAVETLVRLAGEGSGAPIILLELRHLGGALARTPSSLNPMGDSPSGRDPAFVLNTIGPNPSPEVAKVVEAYLARLAQELLPYRTGAAYVNFLELHAASTERVRACYSAEDYKRLVALKERYDPDNLFRFNRNIPPSTSRPEAT